MLRKVVLLVAAIDLLLRAMLDGQLAAFQEAGRSDLPRQVCRRLLHRGILILPMSALGISGRDSRSHTTIRVCFTPKATITNQKSRCDPPLRAI